MSHVFPSLEWMETYATTVAEHPRAEEIATSLHGRYRFVITPGGAVDTEHRYDLVVQTGPAFAAEVAGTDPATLTVRADYPRWVALLTGKADFVMSFLMRRIKVEGDVGAVRSRLSDARPLLDCLSRVPTTFSR